MKNATFGLSGDDIQHLVSDVKSQRKVVRARARQTPPGYGKDAQERNKNIRIIARRWAIFKQLERDGLVEIERTRDNDLSFDDLAGDAFTPAANPDTKPATLARRASAFRQRIREDGVWIMTLLVEDEEITSCGGFIGDDFYGSGYDDDFFSEAIEMLEKKYPAHVSGITAVLDLV